MEQRIFFQEIEKQYTNLLKPYGTSGDISAALFQTEMSNLKYLGYGAKAFTISMVETEVVVDAFTHDHLKQVKKIGLQLQQFHQFSSPTRLYRIPDRKFFQNILPVPVDCIHTDIKGCCNLFT